MGRFYGIKIRAGEKSIEDIQAWWRQEVEKWLEQNPE